MRRLVQWSNYNQNQYYREQSAFKIPNALNKSNDLIYFYGINLFLNNKYFIKNKFSGLSGNIYIFNNKCVIDDDFKIINKQDINIGYLLDNKKDSYYCYSLINCFKESLFFDLFTPFDI